MQVIRMQIMWTNHKQQESVNLYKAICKPRVILGRHSHTLQVVCKKEVSLW
jgi:hypothetical protein